MSIESDFRRIKKITDGGKYYYLQIFDYSTLLIMHYRFFKAWRMEFKWIPLRQIFERFSEFILKAQFSPLAEIGKGLMVFHGYGIVVNGGVKAGNNLTLYHRVTLGERFPGDKCPVLGDNVVIGTGAVVLGPVVIPDGSLVPANAVITPSNVTKVKRISKTEYFGFID